MPLDTQVIDKTPTPVEAKDRAAGFGYHIIYSSPENYEKMVWWYQTLLGGRATGAPDGVPPEQMADADNDTIVIVKRDDLSKSDVRLKPGVLHTAWCYNSLAELFYVYRHARDQGITPRQLLNTEILMQFYYVDPDGNAVETAVDGHDTSEETQAFQRAADGVRTHSLEHWLYDPEKVLKMLEAGVSDYDIFDHKTYHALAASGRFD